MSKITQDWIIFAEAIQQSCLRIIEFTANYKYEDFLKDSKTIDAVIWNLEIIGKSLEHIPPNIKLKHNEIEWAKFAKFGESLIKEYYRVNYNDVWDYATKKVPQLLKEIELILHERYL